MKPMLAKQYSTKSCPPRAFVQPKLNGVRALFENGIFQSRDEHIWNPGVLQHLQAELLSMVPELQEWILDGELYVHGWRLQHINGAVAVNRTAPRDDTFMVEYHVFDAVNRFVGLDQTFRDRYMEVADILVNENRPHIKCVMTGWCDNHQAISDMFDSFIEEGYEGIMVRPDGPYEPGIRNGKEYRSPSLWKYKSWDDAEFDVVRVTQGEGKADIGIGALVLRTPEGREFHCGSGFEDIDRINLMIDQPRRVKVKFNSLSEDGVPVPCIFLCVIS